MPDPRQYSPIGDYAFISDCHSAALVSKDASIDWCCAPRFDSPASFSRLLDADRGGCCAVLVGASPIDTQRRYRGRTMVLETTIRLPDGVLRVTDCLAMTAGGAQRPLHQLIRQLECTEGVISGEVVVAPRFDYGEIPPWIRPHGDGRFSAVGGSSGLLIWSDAEVCIEQHHDVVARLALTAGERRFVSLTFRAPERFDLAVEDQIDAALLGSRLAETEQWWEDWCDQRTGGPDVELDPAELRSALVLKSLVHAPTGAIVAAPTTSLPEIPGGRWNWDYRYSWIRDSWFTVRALADIGFDAEADGFRRFIERTTAGSASELQPLYGVDGSHRLAEAELAGLAGYRGARPVRVGNAAQQQLQLDMFGYLLELSWQWSRRGTAPDEIYWQFVAEVVDHVCRTWQEPDHGIWELRGERRHYVYSKALCWVALDRGIGLATEMDLLHTVDLERWAAARDAVRSTVEERGIDPVRNCFVEELDGRRVDASLLLLPAVGFVAADDPRFVATVEAVIADLHQHGLVRRFDHPDETTDEGAFLACTFWLAECLAELGRLDEAQVYFDRATGAANDLGLLSEEVDALTGEQLGNFPQGFSHLAHLMASRAIRVERRRTNGL